MFPLPNNYNPFDDDDHHHHIKRSSSYDHHQNPNLSISSDHHPDRPSLLPFPPGPFFDDRQLSISPLNQILLQAQTLTQQTNQPEEKPAGPSIRKRTQRNQLGPIPRRRPGKKDRHSKICTAQGIRDRRMRLSLQIARKFFDLQDMLGYDKASKTIEWLFEKSKKAIKELTKAHPQYNDDVSNSCKTESFVISDCEVVSGMLIDDDVKESSVIKPSSRLESRERARARATCRAREKMMVNNDDGIEKLGFLNSPILFEGVDQGSNLNNNNNDNNNNQERVSLFGNFYNSLEQQFEDVGTIEKFLGYPSISSCLNYETSRSVYMDPSMGFFGNWDVMNGGERTNSIPYGVANDQVSFGENPSSIYSATT
ncbi:hypothetical protein CASFOL_020662 [Castilleja foliolosa]|uniref:TCP domain-containing protein n=1 Tax=Castilleja foliolosa TaxID=1961234 RepID=A0ABD3D598_9LAMI